MKVISKPGLKILRRLDGGEFIPVSGVVGVGEKKTLQTLVTNGVVEIAPLPSANGDLVDAYRMTWVGKSIVDAFAWTLPTSEAK